MTESDQLRSLGYAGGGKGARRQDAMEKSVMAPAMALEEGVADFQDGDSGGPADAVVVRTDFRATAFWKPDVVTGDDGKATVDLTLPETLTAWTGKARALGTDTTVGIAVATTRTRKPLLVRLQTPQVPGGRGPGDHIRGDPQQYRHRPLGESRSPARRPDACRP